MTKNKNFAASLIDDYISFGFGERVDEFSIRALDGSAVLELDSISEDSTGEIVGIEVITDDVSVAELLYDDEQFNEKLITEVKSALNL